MEMGQPWVCLEVGDPKIRCFINMFPIKICNLWVSSFLDKPNSVTQWLNPSFFAVTLHLFTHPHSVPHESSGSGFPSIPVDLISSSSSTSWKDSGPSHLCQEGLGVMTSGYVLMYTHINVDINSINLNIYMYMCICIYIYKYIEICVHKAIDVNTLSLFVAQLGHQIRRSIGNPYIFWTNGSNGSREIT